MTQEQWATRNAQGAATSSPSLLRPPLLLHIWGLSSSEELGRWDVADPLVEFKWNSRNAGMTINHEGKPGGDGVFPISFFTHPALFYKLFPCAPSPLSEAPVFFFPPGLIHPQTSILSCPPAYVPSLRFLSLGGGRKWKGNEPALGLPWLSKGFEQFKLEGPAQWAELGVVFVLWPNTQRQQAIREVSHYMYRVLGSCNRLADAWEKHCCVLSLFSCPSLGKCRRPWEEIGPYWTDFRVWPGSASLTSADPVLISPALASHASRESRQLLTLLTTPASGANFEDKVLEVFVLTYHFSLQSPIKRISFV